MQWWGYIAIGIALIVFIVLLYLNRDSPNVNFEGAPPRLVTKVFIIIGTVLIILGVVGYFFPIVLRRAEVVYESAQILESVYYLIGALALQALLVFISFYTIVYKLFIKGEKSDLLPAVIFFTALMVISWLIVLLTGKFDYSYKEPFLKFMNLFSRIAS